MNASAQTRKTTTVYLLRHGQTAYNVEDRLWGHADVPLTAEGRALAGAVSETGDAVALAHGGGWQAMVSHRSGETRDDFIADLVVGVGARFIKSGAQATFAGQVVP